MSLLNVSFKFEKNKDIILYCIVCNVCGYYVI